MFEIRKDDDGSLDEIVAQNCAVHLERMDRQQWWLQMTTPDGFQVTLDILGRMVDRTSPTHDAEQRVGSDGGKGGVVAGDFCGNCKQPWPCGCAAPHQCCGICAGSLALECHCSEREFASAPRPPLPGDGASEKLDTNKPVCPVCHGEREFPDPAGTTIKCFACDGTGHV